MPTQAKNIYLGKLDFPGQTSHVTCPSCLNLVSSLLLTVEKSENDSKRTYIVSCPGCGGELGRLPPYYGKDPTDRSHHNLPRRPLSWQEILNDLTVCR